MEAADDYELLPPTEFASDKLPPTESASPAIESSALSSIMIFGVFIETLESFSVPTSNLSKDSFIFGHDTF